MGDLILHLQDREPFPIYKDDFCHRQQQFPGFKIKPSSKYFTEQCSIQYHPYLKFIWNAPSCNNFMRWQWILGQALN